MLQVSHSVTAEAELDGLCLFQIADSREDLRTFDSSRTNPVTSAPVNLRMPVPQKVNGFRSKMREKRFVVELTFQLNSVIYTESRNRKKYAWVN